MRLTWDQIQANAVSFSKRWAGQHEEKSEAQSFVRDFLAVFGVADPLSVGRFEKRTVKDDGGRTGFMDYTWPKRISIEMKSSGKDLRGAYAQLKDYVLHLPSDQMTDLMMVSDFENIGLHERVTGQVFHFKTKDLRKHIRRFAELAGFETSRDVEDQLTVNVRAAEKMATLHNALLDSGYDGHDLEVYLIRLMFCLFADSTGIFASQTFLNYVQNSKEDGSDLSARIAELFEILNMPDATREKKKLLSPSIRQFRYINGDLFKDRLALAQFDAGMRGLLLDCCHFDWSGISPAIFGAMFQGVMDEGERREIGAHYTSEENILKVIDPLLMDDLWKEFKKAKGDLRALDGFHEKIASLKFLDPACGCGNFLIVAYRELRKLEIEVLKMKGGDGQRLNAVAMEDLVRVNVGQFYGIEIQPWPCQIAKTGMWLMDHLMNIRVSEEFGQYYVRLPLTQGATIVEANALRIDWGTIVPKGELSHILGNPPYKGFKYATAVQKEDMQIVFGETCKTALLDYVAAWFKRAAELMQGTSIETAFVSTNSIVQGTQVGQLWDILLNEHGVKINFAHRTFKWSNEGSGKAAVHCVIIGFSPSERAKKLLVDYEDPAGAGRPTAVKKISPYLVEGDNIVITSRQEPLCNVPSMVMGNQAMDGGNLIIEADDYKAFVSKEPNAKKYIKKYAMGNEFINGAPRYCLWLKDCPAAELQRMPLVKERIANVRKVRAKSHDPGARKLAETPMLFRESRNPKRFAAIPITSSEHRKYVPMGYLDGGTIAGNTLFMIEDATLYHFGVMTSCVHMAWMRSVGGRLEMRYRYSKDIVYNNFPWPDATEKQMAEIGDLAQGVLDTRVSHPDSSLADLYDPLSMPKALLKAHHALDRAVMKLYGFKKDVPEPEIVARLMEMYAELSGAAKANRHQSASSTLTTK